MKAKDEAKRINEKYSDLDIAFLLDEVDRKCKVREPGTLKYIEGVEAKVGELSADIKPYLNYLLVRIRELILQRNAREMPSIVAVVKEVAQAWDGFYHRLDDKLKPAINKDTIKSVIYEGMPAASEAVWPDYVPPSREKKEKVSG